MTVLNVAMFGSDDLAKSIAKATDQRDVHTYVHKEYHDGEAKIISIIRPARYPERLRPLLNAISAGRVGVIEVNSVDAILGEVLVAFASSSIDSGLAIINPIDGEWIDEEIVKKMFHQAGLTKWKFVSNEGVEIRNQLYQLMEDLEQVLIDSATSQLVVSIDQYFNVKGIGLVAIGYVQSGTINVHDELYILPAKVGGNTKSLQVMDDDVKQAKSGDRVGIAIRGAKDDSLNNGSIIVKPAVDDKKTNTHIPLSVIEHKLSELTIAPSPFQKRVLTEGDVIHISVDLQFTVGRVKSVNGSKLRVEWESPVYIRRDEPDSAIIAQLDSKPRIIGSASLIALE
ncbi:MAG: hypothetical protein CMB29_03490 [Euryarchaeota archaeon]|nr:hypothetical protein [Euryarchaeota archaeon]